MEKLVAAAARGGHEERLSVARAEGAEVDVRFDLLDGDGHAAVEDLLDQRVGGLAGGLRGGRGGRRRLGSGVALGRTSRGAVGGRVRGRIG